MSLEAIFTKTTTNIKGVFYLNLNAFSGASDNDFTSKHQNELKEKLNQHQNNSNKKAESLLNTGIELDYLKRIGLTFKGPEFCSEDKKLLISITIDNDSPAHLDILKKTLESVKISLKKIMCDYQINNSDIIIVINFMKIKQNNFLYLFDEKHAYLITKEDTDKAFFYSRVAYGLDLENNYTDGLSFKDIDIVAIYHPGSNKFSVQKFLFIGILPHLKLSASSFSDPIFLLNLEAGAIVNENTIELLFNSLVSYEKNSALMEINDNELYTDISRTTVFDDNKYLLSQGFVTDATIFRDREHSLISNISAYEETLFSIYEHNYRSLFSNFHLSQHCFMFKYSLKYYKQIVDYFLEKQQGQAILDYENNYHIHLSRFPMYIANEMKGEIDFVQSAKVGLFRPFTSYSEWVEDHITYKATTWTRAVFFISYLLSCFTGKGCYYKHFYFIFDIFSVLFDYFFLSIFTIISYIILNFCFKSEYGAYTMVLYYPVIIVLNIVVVYSGAIKQLSTQVAVVNIAYVLFYIFLLITGIIGLTNIYDEFKTDLNKAAFGVLFAFNGVFLIIPYLLYLNHTLIPSALLSAIQSIIFLPNYSSIFLYSSFKNFFSKEYLSLHGLHLIIYFSANFALAFVIYSIDVTNGQKGALGLTVIFTILQGIKFVLILINFFYSLGRSKSLELAPNKDAIITFWSNVNLRKKSFKNQEKNDNERINHIQEQNEDFIDSKSSLKEIRKREVIQERQKENTEKYNAVAVQEKHNYLSKSMKEVNDFSMENNDSKKRRVLGRVAEDVRGNQTHKNVIRSIKDIEEQNEVETQQDEYPQQTNKHISSKVVQTPRDKSNKVSDSIHEIVADDNENNDRNYPGESDRFEKTRTLNRQVEKEEDVVDNKHETQNKSRVHTDEEDKNDKTRKLDETIPIKDEVIIEVDDYQ